MATAFIRVRMNWGGFDLTYALTQTPNYATSQIVSGGASAAVGSGVGVRRVSVQLDRSLMLASLDPAYIHFDFLNMTAGNPDDTWTSGDYSAIEAAIKTFCTAVAPYQSTQLRWNNMIWHRVGTGVTKPNPAERVTAISPTIPGTLSGNSMAPQNACSITFRTGVRRSWGRTYLPVTTTLGVGSALYGSSVVDAIATAASNLVTTAASSDMHLVVVSKPLASSLNVEQIEVDDIPDVVRRRRPKRGNYKKILP